MFNQLTENDIAEMEKVEHRKLVVRPRLLEDVKRGTGTWRPQRKFRILRRQA